MKTLGAISASILVVAALAGCISAETRAALDLATARVEAVEQKAEDLRRERDELLVKLEGGLLSIEDYEREKAALAEKLVVLEAEGAERKAELEDVKKKAEEEKDASMAAILGEVDATLEVGEGVAAAIPAAGFLVPLLGLFRLALGIFRKRKENPV